MGVVRWRERRGCVGREVSFFLLSVGVGAWGGWWRGGPHSRGGSERLNVTIDLCVAF